jgi:hypothetical protein
MKSFAEKIEESGKDPVIKKYREAVDKSYDEFMKGCYDETGTITEQGFARIRDMISKPVKLNFEKDFK